MMFLVGVVSYGVLPCILKHAFVMQNMLKESLLDSA